MHIYKVNNWLNNRNDLEKVILAFSAVIIGITLAFGRQYYWEYRLNQCEKLPELDVNTCKGDVILEKMDSFLGL